MINYVAKSREEQEKDFEEIRVFANPSCMECFGRGYTGWHKELEQLVPCKCVTKALSKATAGKNKKIELL